MVYGMHDNRLCPRCHYVRHDQDSETLPGVCPACGIAYAKWQARQANGPSEDLPIEKLAPSRNAREQLRYQFLYMQSDRDESAFWAHIVLYVVFTAWGWWLIAAGVNFSVIGSSFLHVVNGVFHQYGHVVFSPFGPTMGLLGGSIFQVLVPLFVCAWFTFREGDNFPASLMLWWVGQQFLDIAPYVADAAELALPVPEAQANQHDWNILLGSAPGAGTTLAQFFYLCGVVIILLSNYWGFILLRIEFRGRTGTLQEDE